MAAPGPATSTNPIVFFDVTLGGQLVECVSVDFVYVCSTLPLDTSFLGRLEHLYSLILVS